MARTAGCQPRTARPPLTREAVLERLWAAMWKPTKTSANVAAIGRVLLEQLPAQGATVTALKPNWLDDETGDKAAE